MKDDVLNKAILSGIISLDVLIEKSKKAQIGEVRTWRGGKFKKTKEGKWEPVIENKEQLSIKPFPGLSEEAKKVESRFLKYLNDNLEDVEKLYKKNFDNVISADLVKELSEDYRRDSLNYSVAVHQPSSEFTKYIFKKALGRPKTKGKDKMVLFVTGGPGAGKTSGIENVEDIRKVKNFSDIVHDSVLHSLSKVKENVSLCLNSGRVAVIVHVYRDIEESFLNGVLPRMRKEKRVVPLNVHIDKHIKANKAILETFEEYKGNNKVDIRFVDNSRGFKEAAEVDFNEFKSKEIKDFDYYKNNIINKLNEYYERGEISREEFKLLVGEEEVGRLHGRGKGEYVSKGIGKFIRTGNSFGNSFEESRINQVINKAIGAGIIDVDFIIEKAWKKHPVGTVMTRKDGRKYKKISETGNSNKDWQLVTDAKNKTEESTQKRTKSGEQGGGEINAKDLPEQAKNTSETALQNAIKRSPDPVVREAAHKEMERRQKEEVPQEEKEVGEKSETKKSEKNEWVKEKGNSAKVEKVDISILKTNPNEKWNKRYEEKGFGKEYTDKIAAALKSGVKIPAIEVKRSDNTIIDGQHRYKAALKAGLTEIGVQYYEDKKEKLNDQIVKDLDIVVSKLESWLDDKDLNTAELQSIIDKLKAGKISEAYKQWKDSNLGYELRTTHELIKKLDIDFNMDKEFGLDFATKPGTYDVWRSGEVGDQKNGVFFSISEDDAKAYSEGGERKTKKYKINIKNPLVVKRVEYAYAELTGKSVQDILNQRNRSKNLGDWWVSLDSKVAKLAKQKGYDAITYTSPAPPAIREVVGLYKENINEVTEDIKKSILGEENFNDVLNKPKKENEIKGGKADNLSITDIAKKHKVSVDKIKSQLIMGVKVEMEHTNDPKKALEIAMDHLTESPEYYTKLKEMEQSFED